MSATLSNYLALFQHLPGCFLLLGPDEAATIIDNTAAHAAISMKSRAEVIGRPLFEAYPATSQSEADVLQTSLKYVRRHREPHTMPLIRYDLERPAEQGGGLEERYWQATHHPVLDDAGRLVYILQQTQDVTEQHRAEQYARRMQAELAESQDSLRFLLEALPLMLWVTRPDGVMAYQNPGWLQYTGRTWAHDWADAVHPDDRPGVVAAWQHALRTGHDYQVEYRLRRYDGEYRWHLVRALPRHGADGQILSWVGTGTDIHKQKLSQEQLAAKDRELQQILQRLPALVATLSGPEHVYTFLNERSTELFGDTVHLGMPAALARPELVENGFLHLIDEVYRTGESFSITEVPMAQPPAPDGTVPIRYFDGVFQALTDEQDHSTGILVFGLDVTQRVEAKQRAAELQEAVRQQDEQFRLLVESLPLYVYITDAQGRMLYVNPQRNAYTGQDSARVLTHWLEPVHPDDAARMQALFEEGRQRRQPWSGEYRLRGRDGHYRWVLTHAVPQFDARGEVQRWYGSSVDIDDHKQMQQRLEIKDRELQQILSQLPAYVATVVGPEHRFAFVTPSYQQLLGGRVQLGQRLADLLPELAEQGFVSLLDEVYRTQQPYVAQESALRLWDAATNTWHEHFLNFVYQPLYDAKGQAQGILTFGVDVTEQVRARQHTQALQAEVIRRDEQLRRMTEALPAISYICDAAGHLVYLSPQWYQLTGQPGDVDAEAVWPTLLHPDDRPAAGQGFRSSLAHGTPWLFEYRLRQYDGQYRWQVCRGVPEYDADGRAVRWYGTVVDNHEQKELQTELLRSEARFRFMAESIPQVVWTARPDGQLDYLNARWAEFTGTSVAHALGKGWTDLIPPAMAKSITDKYLSAMRTGEDYEQESPLRSARDGQYRWFLHRATPMRNADGQVVKWFGTSTDIHDFKHAQQQLQAQNMELRRINEDLDNFVYTASHDLKQPVTNMAGIFQELIRSARFDDPAATKLVTMFESALLQIHATIEDLSEVVQVQRQHEQLAPEHILLRGLTQEVLRSVQSQTAELGAEFELDFALVPALRFVRPNLQSLLYNLISNALKYHHPARPPRVRISSHLRDGVPVLEVQDNGLGIDLERHAAHLFKMFRRFHDHVEGSGMGLYLVNRIVQQHEGTLTVESEVNGGTLFRLTLPGTLPADVPVVPERYPEQTT